MKRTICFVAACVLVPVSLLFAADFWETKDYSTWDEEETLKMLEDSPWAKKTRLRESENKGANWGGPSGGFGGGPGSLAGTAKADDSSDSGSAAKSAPDGESGSPESPGEGDDSGSSAEPARGGSGGGIGGGFGGGFGGMAKKDLLGGLPFVVLRWQSALPVKEAMARFRYKDEVKTSKEATESLNRQESVHILGVIGLPGRVQAYRIEQIIANSGLLIDDRPDIKPTQVIPQQEGDTVGLYFVFPKYNPDGTPLITLEDKNLEVSLTTGYYDIVKKFGLKDMVYKGNLNF